MWHQITDELVDLTGDEVFDNGTDLITLFNGFVKDTADNINQLKLMKIAENCARQFEDLADAISFLQDLEGKLKGQKESDAAALFCKVSQAEKRLNQGQYNECQDLLKDVEEKLKFLTDVDRMVFSQLYKVTALYYRRKERFTSFYKAGLQFLAYTPEGELTDAEKKEWSINMGMAVLLGKEIYNIAELCEKEILKALIGTPHEWLYHLLMTLDKGDIAQFEKVCADNDVFGKNELIAKNKTQLDQKVRILAFLDLIFHRDKNSRTISFEEVAKASHVSNEDVELLVMKAISIGLFKGIIDQVDQTIRVEWVQPRMLSKDKLAVMKDKLESWEANCKDVLKEITKEVLLFGVKL